MGCTREQPSQPVERAASKALVQQPTARGTGGPGQRCTPLNLEAPLFTLPDLEGNQVSLERVLDERPALLVFWVTTCGYCVEEIPYLNGLQKEYSDRLAILAIDYKESLERLASFAQKKGVTYTILRDETGEVFKRYVVLGTPTLVVIDTESKMYYRGHILEEAVGKLEECVFAPQAGKEVQS